MISFRLEGLDGLKLQLEELKAQVAARALARAARRSFLPVLAAAQQLVPVDTGLTRDHIKIAGTRVNEGDTVVRVGLKIAAFKGALKAGRKTASPHWRWHFIELGTSKMAAKPFLRPALDQHAALVLAILRDEVANGIARALKRQERKSR